MTTMESSTDDASGGTVPIGLCVEDMRLERPDRRVVAWAEAGPESGRPLVMFPGSPTSRYALRSDHSWFHSRNVRVIVTERPGLGASSPLPGHGFTEPADDVAAILDYRAVDHVIAWGGSGGSPYLLAFAQRYPGRVTAATIVGGTAPITPEEGDALLSMNATFARFVAAGDIDALRSEMSRRRASMLKDPLAAFRSVMETAPERDRLVMTNPVWQSELDRIVREALRQGVEGWLDEVVAGRQRWDEIVPEAVTADVTWWHAEDDRNVSFSAARRFVSRLPRARLRLLASGHLEAYHRHAEILDELLARAV
jgi:pimeloyl-ACP methyl ester carboxylesterase